MVCLYLLIVFSLSTLIVVLAQPTPCDFSAQNVFTSDGTQVLTTNGGVILSIPSFTLVNNAWGVLGGTAEITQTIFTCKNTSYYGWSWNRVNSSEIWRPNYPGTAFGLNPYYSMNPSTTPLLPRRLNQINGLEANMDVEWSVDDQNGAKQWNIAYDIWLTSVNASEVIADDFITDEIMIWFGWNTGNAPRPNTRNAVDDGYNVYDYTETYMLNRNARYHQFRITGIQPRVPPKVNLKAFIQYIQQRFSRSGDLFLSSLEFGSESWDGTRGYTLVKHHSYDFNAVSPTPKPTPKPTTKPTPKPTPKPSIPTPSPTLYPFPSSVSRPIVHWSLDTAQLKYSAYSLFTTSGSWRGDISQVPGKYNGGIMFDGSTFYGDIGNPASMKQTKALTLAAWIKIDDHHTGTIISRQGNEGTRGWGLHLESSGKVSFQIAISGISFISVYSLSSIPLNTWVHVAGSFDPSTALHIYINGVLDNSLLTGVPATQHHNNIFVRLGRRPVDPGYFFKGVMDEVMVFNTSLTEAQLALIL